MSEAFIGKFSFFLVVKFSIYLNRRIFVMNLKKKKKEISNNPIIGKQDFMAYNVNDCLISGQQCGRSSVTLTVQSSDCLTPVNDVTIISADDVTVTNAPSGVYTVESCNLPVSLTLLKPGFESLTTTVLGPTEVLTLNCAGNY